MKKGFTLIELLAVLVVLAILALISIPITIIIINQARENSYKRSIESYGRAVESYIGDYLLEHENIDYKSITYDMIKDNVSYDGNTVVCGNLFFQDNGDIVLRNCQTKNSKYYKYINRQVVEEKYEYGVGETIRVKGIEFYVIEKSGNDKDYVTALKKDPLNINEIEEYGVIDGVNYVNKYTYSSMGHSYTYSNNIGGMAFYSSENCRHYNYQEITSGCPNDYKDSDIKKVVDSWKSDKFTDELKTVDGYSVRLITLGELENLGFEGDYRVSNSNVLEWAYSANYPYWTMSYYNDVEVYNVWYDIAIGHRIPSNYNGKSAGAVRPVINVYKNAID